MTRSATNKESPDLVKKTALQSKQKVILLDTPTPTKETIFEKSRNPTDDSTRRQMRSCASKEMSKNENIKKHWTDKVAQSSSPKKINQLQPYEAQVKLDGKCSSNVPPGQIVVYKSVNTVFGAGIGDQQNTSDPLDDKFYTEDVMEQVEEIIKSAEKSKHSDTIEV
ncbi:Uncharacterized protein Fot_04085 [Forsythia ovata]|uniref:Uncharacterized protein n=1 Tax=Forsythia ovata TaxID=205694 RepID=A0ABD1XBK2_9LAMI